jgi:putative hemolysin
LKDFSSALELGRAFVLEKYQKSYASLYLLWRGIGAYILRYPQYRYLIGPVSISADFPDLSKALLISFLEEKCSWDSCARSSTPYPLRDTGPLPLLLLQRIGE